MQFPRTLRFNARKVKDLKNQFNREYGGGNKIIRLDRMMIKKYGSTDDIANAVLFLCSAKSKYINAEDLVVDGGLLKKGI